MLDKADKDGIAEAAKNGNSAYVIEFMRRLARQKRFGDLALAIDEYSANVQINKLPVRRFLAARVPGILSNHFFPTLEKALFNKFIQYSAKTADWAKPLVAAADASSPEGIEKEVQSLLTLLKDSQECTPDEEAR